MKMGLGFKAVAVLIMVALAALPAAADPLSAFTGQKGEIRISGGTAHIPVMEEAAKRIRTANPDVQISIAGGGSGVGIKQAGEGLVDIGNSGRKPTDEEVAKYGLKVFRWALDGVGAVVHPANPGQSLRKDQLKQIFAGTINNWETLGGPDKAINLYTRDEASGTRDVFWSKALDKGEIHARANVVPSNGAMKTAVANDPYAIGYVSAGHIDATVAPVALDGVTPTIETVKSGAYPVSRGLFSLTKGEPRGLAKLFIEYLFSIVGKQIVTDKGFIPVD